eukprot:g14773.t1
MQNTTIAQPLPLGVLASSTTAVVNSLHDRKSQTHVSSSRRHHRSHRDRGQDAKVKRTSASVARRKHQHEKLGVNDIGKHMHTQSCSHVDDVKVDSLEDYQHMLQALYGEELAQQDQSNVSASDSGAEQSDQESSRRRHKRLLKQCWNLSGSKVYLLSGSVLVDEHSSLVPTEQIREEVDASEEGDHSLEKEAEVPRVEEEAMMQDTQDGQEQFTAKSSNQYKFGMDQTKAYCTGLLKQCWNLSGSKVYLLSRNVVLVLPERVLVDEHSSLVPTEQIREEVDASEEGDHSLEKEAEVPRVEEEAMMQDTQDGQEQFTAKSSNQYKFGMDQTKAYCTGYGTMFV